jgi:aminomethyltransferase
MEPQIRQTPLFEQHLGLKAKMISFAGWNMPVFYPQGLVNEHQSVRERCGVFDVSHMGRIQVTGPKAKEFLEYLCMNLVAKIKIGFGQYSAFLNEQGGFIDDIFLYRLNECDYLLCVNASNSQEILSYLADMSAAREGVHIKELTNLPIQISIQGPLVNQNLKQCMDVPDLEYTQINATPCGGYIARTGYTGEFGYELYLSEASGVKLWSELIKIGVQPVGLGARDTLRLEVCYALHGQDISPTISPLEAGLKWACKYEHKDFVGAATLKSTPLQRESLGIEMIEPAIARQGMLVYYKNVVCGEVTSGSKLPSVNRACAMLLCQKEAGLKLGDEVEVDVRGKRKLARVVNKPFYQPRVKEQSA